MTKMLRALLVAVLIALGAIGLALVGLVLLGPWMWPKPFLSREELLYKINHQEVLSACREVHKDPTRYKRIGSSTPPGYKIDGIDPTLPEAIASLKAASLYVTDKFVQIEMVGGFEHYGFIAYPEGFQGQEEGMKLIDGLSYYSD